MLRLGLSPAEEFSTLGHELAHMVLHRDKVRGKTAKLVRETEAEAFAFVVSQAVGLGTNTAASDYIQLCAGDKETPAASLDRIQCTSTRIISVILDDQQADAPRQGRAATDAYRVNCYARALLTVELADLRGARRALKLTLRTPERSSKRPLACQNALSAPPRAAEPPKPFGDEQPRTVLTRSHNILACLKRRNVVLSLGSNNKRLRVCPNPRPSKP
ncbi:MAG: ImmA/IrrE family metallo-endopeptidase [Planctomycetota bacterium]|jgi:hypothetical protein